MKKRTITKSSWYDWYDWLSNYILEPLKKAVGGVKYQIISPFKTKDYSKPKCIKTVYERGKKTKKLKIQKQSEEDKENIKNLYY